MRLRERTQVALAELQKHLGEAVSFTPYRNGYNIRVIIIILLDYHY